MDYIKSVDKPFQTDADSATGWMYGGTGKTFPSIMMLTQTWNAQLAEDLGEMMGNEALLGGANGWYAPAINIHRTPFSGRNGEYYSEDGYSPGPWLPSRSKARPSRACTATSSTSPLTTRRTTVVTGLNFSVATWSNEQAIREIYLKPFDMCMHLGDMDMKTVVKKSDGTYENKVVKTPIAKGVMTSFNRIGATWTGGSHALIQQLLRDEWGFNGLIITDNANTGQQLVSLKRSERVFLRLIFHCMVFEYV